MTKARRMLIAIIFTIPLCPAAVINYTLDTSGLIGSIFVPYVLDFRLTDGKGTGDANNTVTVTNFAGTGGIGNVLTRVGGVTGDLTSSLKLVDSSATNEFQQEFLPLAQLKFTLTITGNPDSGAVPDNFSLFILDTVRGAHTVVPSKGFDVVGTNAFIYANLDSSTPTVQTFGFGPGVATPEPRTWVLTAIGLACVAARLRGRSVIPVRDQIRHGV